MSIFFVTGRIETHKKKQMMNFANTTLYCVFAVGTECCRIQPDMQRDLSVANPYCTRNGSRFESTSLLENVLLKLKGD